MRHKKIIIILIAFIVFILMFIQIKKIETSKNILEAQKEDDSQKEAEYKIALVMKTITNPFFEKMEDGAKIASNAYNTKLIVKTGSEETSIYQQIMIVEELIKINIDAIVIAPGDSFELIPVLKKAQDSGIKIVIVDNSLDSETIKNTSLEEVPFIGVDNEAGAFSCVDYLCKEGLKKKDNLNAIILSGIEDAQVSKDRVKGAINAFAKNNVNLVLIQSANWKIDEAKQTIKKILKEKPDIDIVFAANDMMALGALDGIIELGREDILVGGYDAIEEALESIKDGHLKVTIDQKAEEQGYLGLISAIKLLKNQDVNLKTILETKLIDE